MSNRNNYLMDQSEKRFHKKHGGHGPSSAWLHDPKYVLEKVKIQQGDVFVDLGCGNGDYAFEASKIVGSSGMVYAVDKWQDLCDQISEFAKSQGVQNVEPIQSDITASLSLSDHSIDVVFIATVLHHVRQFDTDLSLSSEVKRILKPDGRLAIVECKKEDVPFGPPKHMRIPADEMERIIESYGFAKIQYDDLGFNYLIQFTPDNNDVV